MGEISKKMSWIGLIGGILIIIGVFLPWYTNAMDESGWDTATAAAPLVLAGGILVVIGTLHVLGLETPPPHATALIPTGGILVFITTIWFWDKIGEYYLGYDAGYGLYLCLIGGILAIINAVGLKEV